MKKSTNGRIRGCLNITSFLFLVLIFAVLLGVATFLGYLQVEGGLDAFKQDPVKWFGGVIKEDESEVEPIPPTPLPDLGPVPDYGPIPDYGS